MALPPGDNLQSVPLHACICLAMASHCIRPLINTPFPTSVSACSLDPAQFDHPQLAGRAFGVGEGGFDAFGGDAADYYGHGTHCGECACVC